MVFRKEKLYTFCSLDFI